ncbi:MAG: MarR family transcriptional regulator [Rhizobiaceae bacterium]|nr:MarR family transcriptional regulator [Rhizobiaceae bacterium]
MAENSATDHEADRPPPFETLDHGILHEFVGMYLRVAYEVAYEDFTKRLGAEALRPGYFTILTLIVCNPRISQTQIGMASERDKSSVTIALRWMEDNGLITRYPSAQDRRTHMCVATPKGVKMQKKMEEKSLAHLTALGNAIGPERRADFIKTLKDLIHELRQADIP